MKFIAIGLVLLRNFGSVGLVLCKTLATVGLVFVKEARDCWACLQINDSMCAGTMLPQMPAAVTTFEGC